MTTPGEFNAAVGRQLRGEIAAAGSSIARMARDIGVARSALDNYLTNKRSIPVPILYDICVVVDLEPHVLLSRAEERMRADGEGRGHNVIPLHPLSDVPGRRENDAEVAFDANADHRDDTDDLYD